MSRKERFYEMVRRNREHLKRIGVKRIGIFGSVARGEDDERSDYDILVEFERDKKTYRNFTALCDLIEEQLGPDYDLVTREGLSPYIGPHILRYVEYATISG